MTADLKRAAPGGGPAADRASRAALGLRSDSSELLAGAGPPESVARAAAMGFNGETIPRNCPASGSTSDLLQRRRRGRLARAVGGRRESASDALPVVDLGDHLPSGNRYPALLVAACGPSAPSAHCGSQGHLGHPSAGSPIARVDIARPTCRTGQQIAQVRIAVMPQAG